MALKISNHRQLADQYPSYQAFYHQLFPHSKEGRYMKKDLVEGDQGIFQQMNLAQKLLDKFLLVKLSLELHCSLRCFYSIFLSSALLPPLRSNCNLELHFPNDSIFSCIFLVTCISSLERCLFKTLGHFFFKRDRFVAAF